MATKLKNIMCKWQFKLMAHVIIIIAIIGFLYSGYHIGRNWDYLLNDNMNGFYETLEFRSNYSRLVHNLLEKELILIDEAHIRDRYEDENKIEDELTRLDRINRNLEKAKSFKYLLINTETMETVGNPSNIEANDFNQMQTAIMWSSTEVDFPGESVMKGTEYGIYVSNRFFDNNSAGAAAFNMLAQGPYKLYTGFDSKIKEADPFFNTPYQNFLEIKKMQTTYFSIFALSLILGIGAVIYLSIYTGKHPNSDKRKLYKFDYIPYEIQIGSLLMFTLLPFYIASAVYDPDLDYILMALLSASVITWGLLAMHIYLSFIRNIKNHHWLDNILCIRIVKGGIVLFGNMVKSYKPWLIVAFFGICLINMIFALIIPSGPISFLALFVLFNIVVLKYLVSYLKGLQEIMDAAEARAQGQVEYPLNTHMLPEVFQEFAENLNSVQSGLKSAVEEAMRGERMKTELITNVTHDLKNPLTSIINYVDLLKKEEALTEEAKNYVTVLEDKSKRLKDLISHVVEASKASSGNIEINEETLDVNQLMQQVLAEYEEEFELAQLDIITKVHEPITLLTDSKIMYRIIENLLTNIYKYSMPGSRVYITLGRVEDKPFIEMKNISKEPLNMDANSLIERFVRGDTSRNTEGSGLGLSIAESLATALKLELKIEIDGDLFKASLTTSK